MAKKYNNDKGFLVIEMSYDEATLLCNFGIEVVEDEYFVVCDNCNNKFNEKDKIYYFAALNRAFCKECCDDIITNQERYEEDIPYEVRHYNRCAEQLNLEKV